MITISLFNYIQRDSMPYLHYVNGVRPESVIRRLGATETLLD